ncbi:MAG: glycosyltransferase family 39 protein [bacterium]
MTALTRRGPTRHLLFLLLILLLGFALRAHDLGAQSMWSDEGLSLYRARLPLQSVLAGTITVDGVVTQDTNPPFYFLLLNLWRTAAGEDVLALRFLGAALSLLAVPLLYATGRLLYSPRAGRWAALFLAVSPFHVWQAQVLRNYGLLITINLLSVYAILRFMAGSSRQRGWLALWILASLLGIYTHYFGFFIFAFGLLLLLGYLIERYRASLSRLRRQWWLWAVPLAGLLLLAPALWRAFERFRAGRQVDFYFVPASEVLWKATGAYSVGMTPGNVHPGWWAAPGLLLVALGLWRGARKAPRSTLIALLYLFVPLGLLLALSTINPLFNGTRHLLIGLPPFLLLAAPALLGKRGRGRDFVRRLGLTLAVVFLAVQAAWLYRQFNEPVFVRDDVRGAAHFLSDVTRPGDVVLLHDTLIDFTFDYYYQGQAPVIAVPRYGTLDVDEAVSRLRRMGDEYRRVWFVTRPTPRTGFPRTELIDWARRNWYRFSNVDFPWLWLPVQVQGYMAEPTLGAMPADVRPLVASFSDNLQLHGVQLPDVIQAGAPLDLTFYFSRLSPGGGSHGISLRFVDQDGKLWQQIDRPLWPEYPVEEWPLETTIRNNHVMDLPGGLPPGTYQLWMRLIDGETGQPLAVDSGGVDLRLGDVAVQAASCPSSRSERSDYLPQVAYFGRELMLQGRTPLAEGYRPGHLLEVDLYWCVRRTPRADYALRLQLVDEDGDIAGESLGALGRADYPPSRWIAGQQLMSRASIVVPATAGSGEYQLRLSLVTPDRGRPLPVNARLNGRTLTVATVQVVGWPLETEMPPVKRPLRADLGAPPVIEFHGYDLPEGELAPGREIGFTSYWRALSDEISHNYFIFVHVSREGEGPVAQSDGAPVGGFRPTASWRAGEVIVDERLLAVPVNTDPGTYRLSIGLANPDTGERVPVFIDGERQPDDVIFLQEVTVVP